MRVLYHIRVHICVCVCVPVSFGMCMMLPWRYVAPFRRNLLFVVQRYTQIRTLHQNTIYHRRLIQQQKQQQRRRRRRQRQRQRRHQHWRR